MKQIDRTWWDVDALEQALATPGRWELSSEARSAVETCHAFLMSQAAGSERAIYGVNTGFGDLAHTRVLDEQLAELQRRILISHACGVGDDVPDEVVRRMLVLKVKALAQGHSGVAPTTVERLLDFLNAGLLPVVPSQGSLGASGDLAPLAHLVLPLIGEGELKVDGVAIPAGDVLAGFGWKPLELGAKEGLALINGTQLMLAYGAAALARLDRFAEAADAVAAWSLEAWHGRSEAFAEAVHAVRHQTGAIAVAERVRTWIEGSAQMREPRTQVQDPYSFRCVPQVHGASVDVVAAARTIIERELNAVTDNPLVFPETGEIISGGNFHGQPLALQFEAMGLAAHEWASISERRVFKLLSGRHGLPPFLASNPGLNSGYMIPQYTAASLVSQNKQLTTPAAADTIDSSNGQEDHVSMGANGALKLWRILDNAEQVLAVEAMCAAQACDLRGTVGMAPRLVRLQASLRERVPFLEEDAFMQPLMLEAREWLFQGGGAELVKLR
jgi:histidine ammonia-lyase